jgi:hypothetical protein
MGFLSALALRRLLSTFVLRRAFSLTVRSALIGAIILAARSILIGAFILWLRRFGALTVRELRLIHLVLLATLRLRVALPFPTLPLCIFVVLLLRRLAGLRPIWIMLWPWRAIRPIVGLFCLLVVCLNLPVLVLSCRRLVLRPAGTPLTGLLALCLPVGRSRPVFIHVRILLGVLSAVVALSLAASSLT